MQKQCEACKNEFEGYGKNCPNCRKKLSRMSQKPMSQVLDVTETSVLKSVVGPVASFSSDSAADLLADILKNRPWLKNWIEMVLNPDCQNAFQCFAGGVCSC